MNHIQPTFVRDVPWSRQLIKRNARVVTLADVESLIGWLTSLICLPGLVHALPGLDHLLPTLHLQSTSRPFAMSVASARTSVQA